MILLFLVGFSLPASAASGLFLKTPPAANAFFLDLTGSTSGDTLDSRATCYAIQGLINRSSAEVYLKSRGSDTEQLQNSGKPYTVLTLVGGSTSLRGVRTLFNKYHPSIQKMFVYDPAKDWTFYLAFMAGAQQNGIPVTETVRAALQAQVPAWAGTVVDYTNMGADRIEGYDWALANLMPNCTKQSVYFARAFDLECMDYVAASKSFVFNLLTSDPGQEAKITEIFATPGYGVGTSLGGYAGDSVNRLANPYGIGYNVSDFYSNGSFWSSFPNKTYTQPAGEAVTPQNGKVYVAILLSDGDNLQFDQGATYSNFKDINRGTVPVGTSLAPVLQEINTPLLDWYYANKTSNDELIAGPCGFQFIYLDDYSPALLPAWCEINAQWIAGAGFHTSSVWLGTFGSDNYKIYTATSGVSNIRHNADLVALSSNPRFSNGVPVFNERIRDCQTEEELYEDLAGVAANASAPVFATGKLITARWPYTKPDGTKVFIFTSIKTVVDRLNTDFPGKYVFQLPRDQAETAREYLQPKRTWNTGNGTWNTTTANWVKRLNGASVADTYTNNVDAVAFEDASGVTVNPIITLNSAFTPKHVSMKSTLRDYTISGTGAIGGSTSLILDPANTRTLTLACNNTYTGVTAINGGTLQIGNGGTTGSLATTSAIINDAALVFNRSNAITQGTHFATAISGSGTLANTGTGTLTLNGANTYKGATTISNGVLILTSSQAMQDSPLNTLNSIAGSLRTTATGLTLGGLTGNKNLAAVFTPSTGGYSGLTTLTLNPASGAAHSYSADIGNGNGSMSLIKTGPGTQILNGTNTHTGSTSINNGILKSGVDNALPAATALSLGSGATAGGLDLETSNQTVATLNVSSNSASANTLTIGSGKTLTVTGGMTVGFDSAANTTTKLAATGLGTLSVTSGNLQLGGSITTGFGSAATLDMSGLANFSYNNSTGTVRVGDATNSGGGGTGSSTLILAETSTITAATLTTNSPAAQQQFIKLGSVANTINATTIQIGNATNRTTGGTLVFNEATGSLTVRGVAGGASRATTMAVGYGGATTAGSSTNLVDLTGAGHTADLLVTSLQIAGRTSATANGGATSIFSFGNGTLDATGVTIGLRGAVTSGTNTGVIDGTLNLGGGMVAIGSSGLNVASNASSLAGNTVTGTVNISGAAVTITGGGVTLGSNSNAAGIATTANLNISGGSLTVGAAIAKGSTTGTVNSTITLNGGTLNMAGFAIGATGAGKDITLTAESGELKNVATINGSGGLTKTAAGTLVLSGTNTYTGATTVNGGILSVSSDVNLGAVPGSATPGQIVLNGGTLRTTTAFTIHANRGITLGASGGRINNAADGNLIYNGIIAGTSGGALTVTHAGSSGGDLSVGTFAAANTYDGATLIDDGHLSVNNLVNGGSPSSIGLSSNAAANLVLKNTAILHYQGGAAPAATTDRLFTLGTGDNELRSSGNGGITFGNTGSIASTDSGTRTLSLRAVTAGATNTLASIIGDGAGGATSLHKHGPGTWRLSGANTYTGETRINSGILTLGTGGSLGNGNYAGDILIGDGASLSSNTTLPQILSGVITGAGTLRQNGPGEITLAGANTFTGTTSITSGVMSLANSMALQNSPLDTLNSITGNATTGLKTTMTALTLGGLTGNKNLADLFINTGGGYSGLTSLTLNPGSGISHSYSGDIGNGNGSLNLIKTGLGTQILSGTSTHSGTTTIGQGTLAFAATNTSLAGVLIFGATDGSTTTGALDLSAGSATFGGLVVRTNSAINNAITIGAGRTLATNGNVTIGTDIGVGIVTNLTVSGNGSWTITNSAASGSFAIGGALGTNTSIASLDMSGLGTFNANLSGAGSTFRLGDNNGAVSTPVGSLKLAANSTITAATLGVSDISGSGTMRTLSLGTGVNTINATNIRIGEAAGNRGSGTIDFQDAVNGTLVIRSQSGATGTANLTLVNTNNSGGSSQTGRLLLAGHHADVSLNAIVMASRSGGAGTATGEITFDNGTFSANTISMTARTGSTAMGTATGTITIGGGTASLGAVTMAVNTNTNAATGLSNATLTINNGNVTATSINMGNAGSTGSVKTANGNLNLNGGTLTLTTGNITRTGGTGNENAIITLNGGTLNMNGRNIGTVTAAISLVAQSGALQNLAFINGSGGITKTTGGMLTISGTNTSTGPTTISEGTLVLGATNVLPNASAVSIDNATLNAATAGTEDAGTLAVTGTATINLAAGAGIEFDASNAIPWPGSLNFTGTFVSGVSLKFGVSNTALTSTQLGKISATGFTGFALNGSGYLTATPAGFSSWITGTFANGQVPLDKRGANDDPDNDGIRNLVEYAVADQDPTVSNASIGSFTGTTLSFTKRPGTSGLTYAIQKSADLGLTDVWAEVTGGSYVNNATTISATLTPGTPPKNFLRLQVLAN